ncbi:hypothetical protein HGRIS_001415 [Hohenbuehelia grisea]|uniref:Aconitase/3-isopropylmalate dehydratase large subunit alpha/beta/alpha domain-containing protein n=1 Tax=Hohenbuehelia grisea TaxID=104357 RepID=A0ABR3JP81_9AGAR
MRTRNTTRSLILTFQSSTSSRLTNKWPAEPKVSLIGSCTNSSYEDMSRSASIAKEAKDHRLQVTSKFIITPGSEQVRVTIERKSQIAALKEVGGLVLAKAYSPEETRKRMKTVRLTSLSPYVVDLPYISSAIPVLFTLYLSISLVITDFHLQPVILKP